MQSTRNCAESLTVCVCFIRRCPSPVTNMPAQSVNFLRHKASLTSDIGSASSTKCRTAIPSATTWHLSVSFSSRRQRSIGMINYKMFIINPRMLYWTTSQEGHKSAPYLRLKNSEQT